MSSRIEKLAQNYKESKTEIRTAGIIDRVQIESALAEEESNVDIKRFGQGMELLQSGVSFASDAQTGKRLAKRAGKEFGILDFLVGNKEALAAADYGAALESSGKILENGVEVAAPSIYEEDAKAKVGPVAEFRSKVQKATEKALGRKLTKKEIEAGSTNQEMGSTMEGKDYQYATSEEADKKVEAMGLEKKSPLLKLFQMFKKEEDEESTGSEKKSPFSNLFQMFRGAE